MLLLQLKLKCKQKLPLKKLNPITFVVNGRESVTQEDEYVARLLQKTKKPILLAVNKIDDGAFINDIYDFYSLGIRLIQLRFLEVMV